MKRVVVTGLGPVSSIGIGKETFWENARQGRGYFRNVDFDDVDFDDERAESDEANELKDESREAEAAD